VQCAVHRMVVRAVVMRVEAHGSPHVSKVQPPDYTAVNDQQSCSDCRRRQEFFEDFVR
jgi:hypothetical protein